MEIEDFIVFQTWQLVFLEPVGVQRRYVPHLKGLISGNLELTAQGRDSTFTFLHYLFEKGHFRGIKGQRCNIHFC